MITEATRFIADYGYWGIAGVVGLESMGIPLPGETILIAAAAWAAFSHQLSIELVIAAAAAPRRAKPTASGPVMRWSALPNV